MQIVIALILCSVFTSGELRKERSPSKPKIVGGQPANIINFPYQLSLQISRHICGGSILSTTHALTAAHCREGEPVNQFRVRVGSNYTIGGGQVVGLTAFLQHSNYNRATFDYDYAILKFGTALTFSQSISAINLPNKDLSVPGGTRGTVTGWGHQRHDGVVSFILLMAEVPTTTRAYCSQIYAQSRVTVTDRMLCAGGEANRGICQGDSGGAFAINGVVVGISSATIGCGQRNYPGLFANVFNQLVWIKQNANL